MDFAPRSTLRVAAHHVYRARIPAIDFHNHLDEFEPADVLRVMDACNVEQVLNITTMPGDDGIMALHRFEQVAPDRFHTCMWMDWRDLDRPDFFKLSVERLRRFVDAGGCGIKLWKDFGLTVHDARGALLAIDDERMAPLYEAAGELGVFVMFHTTDPEAFFFPVDRYNERFEELSAHPDWSFHDSPVSRAEVLAQRDRVFRQHPRTRFVGAHMAEQAEDLGALGELLDECPNVSVDVSARVNELGRQPYSTRRFFAHYADRILFGTDLPVHEDVFRGNFRFFETEDEYFDYPSHTSRQGRWMVYGLNLPDEVLRKVYRDNALRLLAR